MPVNRIQVGGSNPSPDRQDFNLVAGTGVGITAADDATNNVSKATFAFTNLGDGTVTQATSISTGVTLNAASGVITTVSATTAAQATAAFTVTNSAVASTSVVLLALGAYSGTFGTNGTPLVSVSSVSAGSFQVTIYNAHAANALAGTLKINFAVV